MDIYFEGKIYTEFDYATPSGTLTDKDVYDDHAAYLRTLNKYITAVHAFKNGENVTGKYRLVKQRIRYGVNEWVNCDDEEFYAVEAERRRIIAIDMLHKV